MNAEPNALRIHSCGWCGCGCTGRYHDEDGDPCCRDDQSNEHRAAELRMRVYRAALRGTTHVGIA